MVDEVDDEVDDEVVEDGNLFMYYYSWKNLNIMILILQAIEIVKEYLNSEK